MIYRFKLVCEEVPGFSRVIDIDPDAKFLELCDCILTSVGYVPTDSESFYICDDDWQPEVEVPFDERTSSSDRDSYSMKTTELSELIEDEGVKLTFMFDPAAEREFFMELREILFGESVDKATCIKSVGVAPEQIMISPMDVPEIVTTPKVGAQPDMDMDFSDEEGYNDDEISVGFDFGEEKEE